MQISDHTRIRVQFAVLLILILIVSLSTRAQITITPLTPPVVNQGQTFKFTESAAGGAGVTWSCPGCKGSIDPSTGVYTAPAIVNSQQSYGGYQVLPNDHIFNTRIDSLPVNANSATWIAGSAAGRLNYIVGDYPINFINGSTPAKDMVFYYTSANNDSFRIPPYPMARIQAGWFTPTFGPDRHFFGIDTTNGTFQEMYNYYAPGTHGSCPTCTSQGGFRYSNSTYALPVSGATNAAGTAIIPLTIRLQELENAVTYGGTIHHAINMTLQNSFISSSFVWPALVGASGGTGAVPYGARFRLKSSFNISGFSTIAQVILTQLKQYGLILTDAGGQWQSGVEATKWPTAYFEAFLEIQNAKMGPSNFEAVDESGIEVQASSGLTTTSEKVCATNGSGSACQHVVLTGVTVNLPKDAFYIQAGAPAQQLSAHANIGSVTWSMSPTVGNLASEGLYTPPATESSPATTTITATSTTNSSMTASMPLTVMPSGVIRVTCANGTNYGSCGGNYTDSNSHIWYPMTGDDGGFPYDQSGACTWSGTDIALYKNFYNASNDMRYDIYVPNGTFQVVAKIGAGVATGHIDLEAQGMVQYSNINLATAGGAGGGVCKPNDYTLTATVTNNLLSFVVRQVDANPIPYIGSLQITQTSSSPNLPTRPAPPTDLTIHVN